MKKIILFLSILIAGVYITNFISAISINKSAGDILDTTTWGEISSVTDKISVSGGDMKINGKIYISGKLCDNNGKCLGDKVGTEDLPGTSCKTILEDDNTYLNQDGLYWIDPNGGDNSDKFQAYCDMTTDGGGWTLLGKTLADYPPTNWLTTSIGTAPSSLSINALYSIDGSKIAFTELIAGINGDTTKHYGFKVPTGFIQSRFFEETNTGTETCTQHEMYYTTDSGTTKKGYYAMLFKETLVSDRGIGTGGLDFASANCTGSYNELAIYRENDNHGCGVGVCSSVIGSFHGFYGGHTNGPTPSYPIAKGTEMLANGTSMSTVWIMVK